MSRYRAVRERDDEMDCARAKEKQQRRYTQTAQEEVLLFTRVIFRDRSQTSKGRK